MEKSYKIQLWLIAIGIIVLAILGILSLIFSINKDIRLSSPTLIEKSGVAESSAEPDDPWSPCASCRGVSCREGESCHCGFCEREMP